MQLKFFNLPVDVRQRIYKINDDRILNRLKVRNDYFKKLIINELELVNDDVRGKFHDMNPITWNWCDYESFINIPELMIEWINDEYEDANYRWKFIRDATNDTPIKRYTRFNSKFDNEPILICRRIDREVQELRCKIYCSVEEDTSDDESSDE